MESFFGKLMACTCCDPDAKFPNPYNFRFSGSQQFQENEQLFQSNFVRTSKYSIFSFFPKALLLQFKRLANVYFLIIAILQTIPAISPLSPLTAWAPLIVIIAISMIREGYQDYQRYKSDKKMNYEDKTDVFIDGKFKNIQWSSVKVGDICRVYSEEMFPVDLILLSSSSQGSAFIETASLDGEKNLKPRNAFKDTAKYDNEENLLKMTGNFQGIVPDKELHKFSSKMAIDGKTLVIEGDKQLLYRGSRLKNTKWVYGLSIYTGRNTKIMMNSQSSAEKMSQIEVKVNYILGIVLGIQLLLCIVCAIIYGIFRNQNQETFTYVIWPEYEVPLDAFLMSLTYLVLFNTMIPISLIVSIEMVKVFQKYFIDSDKMLFSKYRNCGVTVKSSSLNQELGQIEYVFSDKTGTLTLNVMQFKIAVVGNRLFGDLSIIDPNIGPSIASKDQFNDPELKAILQKAEGSRLPQPITVESNDGKQALQLRTVKQLGEEYMMVLSLAHQVVVETNKEGKTIYQGPSPDEITLVEAGKKMGYQFLKATQSEAYLLVHGRQTKFDLLEVFSFTSDRKRMSVVVRDPDNGKMKMYIKGADNIIENRLSPKNNLKLDEYLKRFSRIGLRTLLVGMKLVSEEEYAEFKKQVGKLPAENREQPLSKLIDAFERGFFLVGATAVLDRLQDQVPETIRDLLRANIKVWMLTGDKMETAENIAKSCNLIQPNFQVLKYSLPPERKNDQQAILKYLKELSEKSKQLTQEGQTKAFLIEGGDLTNVLKEQANKQEIANLASNCQAVVGCRLLPSQKAQVVQVVRKYLNKITLSIGDGANDVPMIKQAHIGVGLFGQQGMGAVQASDYSLPQFRMLWRLLLVHGRWNYIRISQMILYFFYKNMLFTFPQFLAAFYVAYSGQTIFDDIYVALYNLVFTSIPLIIRAVLEQDVTYIYPIPESQPLPSQITNKTLIEQEKYLPKKYKFNKFFYRLFPKIYFVGQENCVFNYQNYFAWMAEAVIQACIIFFVTVYALGGTSISDLGYNSDFWIVGITIYSSVIVVVTFKLATHTRFWSNILIFSIVFFTIIIYISYMWISNLTLLSSNNVEGTIFIAYTIGETYFIVLLNLVVVLAFDGVVVYLDFTRGGYASKMRDIADKHRMDDKSYYNQVEIVITDNLSQMANEIEEAQSCNRIQ